MSSSPASARPAAALAWLAIAGVLVLGVAERLADPLATRVIPAEDPYTHMSLVREHVRDGSLDPQHEGGRLYPPGMHAYLAAAWTFTGVDLYDLIRVGPPVLGAMGLLGIALLLARLHGLVAALLGTFALALLPEAVLRTTMMAPTALDLAVLPFLFLALFEVVRGRLGWSWIAGVLVLLLVFAHPWALSIVAVAGVLLVALAKAFPWSPKHGPSLDPRGVAAAAALVGVGWGLALSGCGGWCGPGFDDVYSGGRQLRALAPLVAGLALAPAVLLRVAPRSLDWLRSPPHAEPRSLAFRAAAAGAFAAAAAGMTTFALRDGLPPGVDLVRLFAWPVLLLAAVGLATAPLRAAPAAHVGAAIVAATYPFVVFNPFHSAFWSHRTAVYLGLGLALLAGVAGATIARLAARAAGRRGAGVPATGPSGQRSTATALVTLVTVGGLAGAVDAATPDADRWYRMFPACQYDVLVDVARHASDDPAALVVTGAWQSKLVVAAFTDNASRVWFQADFFQSPGTREGILTYARHRTVIAVVDGYLTARKPPPDLAFLDAAPWKPLALSCPAPDQAAPAVIARIAPGDLP